MINLNLAPSIHVSFYIFFVSFSLSPFQSLYLDSSLSVSLFVLSLFVFLCLFLNPTLFTIFHHLTFDSTCTSSIRVWVVWLEKLKIKLYQIPIKLKLNLKLSLATKVGTILIISSRSRNHII